MESASLLSRESTTLSFANPQKGHFMALGTLASDCNRDEVASDRWRRGRKFSASLRLLALCRKLSQRQAFPVSQQQANRNHRDERDHPQQNAATGRQLMRRVEDVLQRRNGRQL